MKCKLSQEQEPVKATACWIHVTHFGLLRFRVQVAQTLLSSLVPSERSFSPGGVRYIDFIIIGGSRGIKSHILCEMIKGNELDVADIVFEILAMHMKEFRFFCFILFLVLINCS